MIRRLTCFQGLWSCETVLQERFDWRYLCASVELQRTKAMEQDLLALCEKYKKSVVSNKVVIEEPYLPYIPQNWNQILVLAESQNLSLSNEEYVKALRKLDSEDRMKRLGHPKLMKAGDGIGVSPWDDGSLKLAIEAALDVSEEETAVSNAVLWSQRDSNPRRNATPDEDLKKCSSALWCEMLDILKPKPKLVICSGNTAYAVIKKAGWSENKIKRLRLPSPTAMSRVSGMFDENDLLRRYPEVKEILGEHPEWGERFLKNKIFFACHAVSSIGGNMVNPNPRRGLS